MNMITKEEWRKGLYRDKEEFKTQEGYYNAVSEFVKEYGEPIEKDMMVGRSGFYKEFQKGTLGASWNPNANNTRFWAKFYKRDYIYAMLIPKGTLAVHFDIDKNGYMGFEEEYVFDMKGLGLDSRRGWKDYNVGIMAKHYGEWDDSNEFETNEDFNNWELLNIPKYYNTNQDALYKFFEKQHID